MLRTYSGEDFTAGSLTYREDPFDEMPLAFQHDDSQKIYIPVYIPALNGQYFALVDTGAPYVILGGNLLRELGIDPGADDPKAKPVKTRHGTLKGTSQRLEIQILAEEGDSISVDATVYCCDWPDESSIILGYQGFLQRLRFGVCSVTQQFHFGA